MTLYEKKERISEDVGYRNSFGSVLLHKSRTNTLKLNWRCRFEAQSVNCKMCKADLEDLKHFFAGLPGVVSSWREACYDREDNWSDIAIWRHRWRRKNRRKWSYELSRRNVESLNVESCGSGWVMASLAFGMCWDGGRWWVCGGGGGWWAFGELGFLGLLAWWLSVLRMPLMCMIDGRFEVFPVVKCRYRKFQWRYKSLCWVSHQVKFVILKLSYFIVLNSGQPYQSLYR